MANVATASILTPASAIVHGRVGAGRHKTPDPQVLARVARVCHIEGKLSKEITLFTWEGAF